MSTNFYFNNFQNSGEQGLIEDLVIESIRIYGHDVFYCPRQLVNYDHIYGEDPISEYNKSYEVEMYIKSYDSYEGDGTFLSKFNLEIRDQVTFTIAVRTFANEIGQYEQLERPREGDLIYFTMTGRILVIKYVNKVPIFYQMGNIQMYDLVCEMWEYSGEKLNTGIGAIDTLEKKLSLVMEDFAILTSDGLMLADSSGYPLISGDYDFQTQARDAYEDNTEIQYESNGIIDFTEVDPFSEGHI